MTIVKMVKQFIVVVDKHLLTQLPLRSLMLKTKTCLINSPQSQHNIAFRKSKNGRKKASDLISKMKSARALRENILM